MYLKKGILIFAMCLVCLNSLPTVAFAEDDNSVSQETQTDDTLKDSGIDYTESTQTINNPAMGYTQTIWYTCKPNDTPVQNPTGNLVLMFVNIGAFSSGVNGSTDDDGNYTEGTDYDLDESFFEGLRGTFENARKNGCTIALRFRYDANGKSNPEPSSFEQVLKHIQQIKDSNILEDYKDILMFVESGFVGEWGEQWGGKYVSLDYKAQLLDAMLDCVPDDIPVTVRTPNTFAKWAGIEMSELADYQAEGDARRVGLYNDGYMGSDTDLGTFTYNRELETTWLGNQTTSTYYGGEFSGNLEWTKKYDTYLPENAIPEMYKTHLTYINSNIYSLYKDYTFSSEYDVPNVDNSAYYGETVYKFIRDHLGYRFVLRDSELSTQVSQGETLNLSFDVENTGFANPIKSQKAEVILEKDGKYITTEVDIDSTKWYSCTSNSIDLSLKIPNLEVGEWNVYLRLSVGNNSISESNLRTVKFANNDIWNTSLGANYLGSFDVTSSVSDKELVDNTFYQTNAENPSVSNGDILTYDGLVILDGQPSSDNEWTESSKLVEDGDNELYVSNDDEYLYVMAKVVQSVDSPVYNLRIVNATNGETYWLYYQPNGYIYFNHNDGKATGCTYSHVGDYVEFKVPFGDIMGLGDGVVLTSVEVNVQDMSQTGWPSAGRIKSGEYTINSNFTVYTTSRDVTLEQNSTLPLTVETSLTDATYQWYLNSLPIDGATAKTYTLEDATSDSIGMYSVKVTSSEGIEKTIDICNVLDVITITDTDDNTVDSTEEDNNNDSDNNNNDNDDNNTENETLIGDIIVDGNVDYLDVFALKKAILGLETAENLSTDLNQDGYTNVIDLIQLKGIILNS